MFCNLLRIHDVDHTPHSRLRSELPRHIHGAMNVFTVLSSQLRLKWSDKPRCLPEATFRGALSFQETLVEDVETTDPQSTYGTQEGALQTHDEFEQPSSDRKGDLIEVRRKISQILGLCGKEQRGEGEMKNCNSRELRDTVPEHKSC